VLRFPHRATHRVARSWLSFPLALAVVLGSAASLAACGGGSTAAPVVVVLPEVTMPPGQMVYAHSCAKCHGQNREGKAGDGPKLDSVRIASLGDQTLRITITTGKGKMQGFPGLTQTQVDDLVGFLKSA
jgi:mono/diheme cytochrome c family protein